MTKKLAKLKYLPNNFQIIQNGDYVECAVSGKKIDIENFPYNKNDSSNKSSKFWLFAIIAILSFWLSNPISHYSLAYPYMGRTK